MTYKVPPNGVKVWQPFFKKKKQRGVGKTEEKWRATKKGNRITKKLTQLTRNFFFFWEMTTVERKK